MGEGKGKGKEKALCSYSFPGTVCQDTIWRARGENLFSFPILSSHQAWVSSSTCREDIFMPALCTKNPNCWSQKVRGRLWMYGEGRDMTYYVYVPKEWLCIIVYICNDNTQERRRVWINIENLSKRVERKQGKKAGGGSWRGASTWVTGFLWLFQKLHWI